MEIAPTSLSVGKMSGARNWSTPKGVSIYIKCFVKNFFWSFVIWVRNFTLNRYLSDIPRTYLLFLVDRALCDPFQLLLFTKKSFSRYSGSLFVFSPKASKTVTTAKPNSSDMKTELQTKLVSKVGGYGPELCCPVDTLSSSMACGYNDGKLFTWVIECFVLLYCLGVLFLSPKPLGRPAFFNAGGKIRL